MTMQDRYPLAVMRSVLNRWGAICELARNWNGYPSCDTTHRAAFANGGGERRLPILNVPAFAIRVSAEVMKLPDDEGNAVTIYHAHHFNAEGTWISTEQKALILGIGVKALRYREQCGREQLIENAPDLIDVWQAWEDERDARRARGASAALAQLGT